MMAAIDIGVRVLQAAVFCEESGGLVEAARERARIEELSLVAHTSDLGRPPLGSL
jgi:hypothetical protein